MYQELLSFIKFFYENGTLHPQAVYDNIQRNAKLYQFYFLNDEDDTCLSVTRSDFHFFQSKDYCSLYWFISYLEKKGAYITSYILNEIMKEEYAFILDIKSLSKLIKKI